MPSLSCSSKVSSVAASGSRALLLAALFIGTIFYLFSPVNKFDAYLQPTRQTTGHLHKPLRSHLKNARRATSSQPQAIPEIHYPRSYGQKSAVVVQGSLEHGTLISNDTIAVNGSIISNGTLISNGAISSNGTLVTIDSLLTNTSLLLTDSLLTNPETESASIPSMTQPLPIDSLVDSQYLQQSAAMAMLRVSQLSVSQAQLTPLPTFTNAIDSEISSITPGVLQAMAAVPQLNESQIALVTPLPNPTDLSSLTNMEISEPASPTFSLELKLTDDPNMSTFPTAVAIIEGSAYDYSSGASPNMAMGTTAQDSTLFLDPTATFSATLNIESTVSSPDTALLPNLTATFSAAQDSASAVSLPESTAVQNLATTLSSPLDSGSVVIPLDSTAFQNLTATSSAPLDVGPTSTLLENTAFPNLTATIGAQPTVPETFVTASVDMTLPANVTATISQEQETAMTVSPLLNLTTFVPPVLELTDSTATLSLPQIVSATTSLSIDATSMPQTSALVNNTASADSGSTVSNVALNQLIQTSGPTTLSADPTRLSNSINSQSSHSSVGPGEQNSGGAEIAGAAGAGALVGIAGLIGSNAGTAGGAAGAGSAAGEAVEQTTENNDNEDDQDNDEQKSRSFSREASTLSSMQTSTQISSSQSATQSSATESSMTSSASSSAASSSTVSSSSSSASAEPSSCLLATLTEFDAEYWEGESYEYEEDTGNDSPGRRLKRFEDETSELPIGQRRRKREALSQAAAAITPAPVAKKVPGRRLKVGSCVLPEIATVTTPPYASLKAYKRAGQRPAEHQGRAGALYNSVQRWFIGKRDNCYPFEFRSGQTSDINAAGVPAGSSQSIDHVYELQMVERFLIAQFAEPGCGAMNKIFFPCGTTNYMQSIFDALPGNSISSIPYFQDNGFAALEEPVNQIKGMMFSEDLVESNTFFGREIANDLKKLETIQSFVMMFEIFRYNDFSKMFDITNNRMYKVWQELDTEFQRLNDAGGNNGATFPVNMAQSYRAWVPTYLNSIVKPAWAFCDKTVRELSASLPSDPKYSDSERKELLARLSFIQNHGNFSESFFTIPFPLTWNLNHLKTRKLANFGGGLGSCALPQANTTSATFSATQTSNNTATVSPQSLVPPVGCPWASVEFVPGSIPATGACKMATRTADTTNLGTQSAAPSPSVPETATATNTQLIVSLQPDTANIIVQCGSATSKSSSCPPECPWVSSSSGNSGSSADTTGICQRPITVSPSFIPSSTSAALPATSGLPCGSTTTNEAACPAQCPWALTRGIAATTPGKPTIYEGICQRPFSASSSALPVPSPVVLSTISLLPCGSTTTNAAACPAQCPWALTRGIAPTTPGQGVTYEGVCNSASSVTLMPSTRLSSSASQATPTGRLQCGASTNVASDCPAECPYVLTDPTTYAPGTRPTNNGVCQPRSASGTATLMGFAAQYTAVLACGDTTYTPSMCPPSCPFVLGNSAKLPGLGSCVASA